MAPRQQPRGENPDQIGVPGGGGTSKDYLYDIFQRLSSIESSIAFAERHTEESDRKVDSLGIKVDMAAKELAEAKAAFAAVKPIVTGIGRSLWAIAGGLIVFLLSIAAMWLKHRMGW